ncbi:MAG: tetratricopeptide repeat protein, partial [Verrucomicrobiae bacterium]|nr:tetratricopeptide repeat protein [Verrucomicrobiae bacterium]
GCRKSQPTESHLLSGYNENGPYGRIEILYPLDETVFPPEIVPPVVRWNDATPGVASWVIRIRFSDGGPDLVSESRGKSWVPRNKEWQETKRRSREQQAQLTILGISRGPSRVILSRGRVMFKTSKDEVGAPIFYRDVPLPFIEAVQDPRRIRWRFGTISSESPGVVLENLPVCGNCHSFSKDGAILGMDVDYANNKGSYIITRTRRYMTLATSEIITWDDYKRDEGEPTYGFLSQVSPDGRYVISTVKDKSVFVARPDLAFSQLFFPIKGLLVVYNCETKTFKALPGADDPRYVQSNPVWSPDGRYIVFARAPAYQLRETSAKNKLLLSPSDCNEFLAEGKPFRYDLYRIPFNDGNGGEPQPIEGASNNGFSNYFPRYSPDGKWIVFCRARNYMLLQPDSELYIIPAGGGQARRLRANTNRMNSWHSWSPNSRWLVFASKANSPYTQLFLTHIDEDGESSPPVVLDRFTAPDRAANIPEFVRLPADGIEKIRERFVDDYSMARAAYISETQGAIDDAIRDYRKALEINPRNVHAHQRLGFLLYNMKQQRA